MPTNSMPTVTAQRTTFLAPLHPGADGGDVAQAQTMLVELGLPISSIELRERRFGPTTAEAVIRWRERQELPPDDILDLESLERLWKESRELARSVFGRVTLDDGTPVPRLHVVAIDRDFRDEQTLGEAQTDNDGRYRIVYRASDALRAEKGAADLGVRVFSADRKSLLRAPKSRDLVMNAPPEVCIDVTVNAATDAVEPEFARILSILRPLIGKVTIADIGLDPASDEGDFLARETGLESARLAHFVVAHRLTRATEISPEYFYALLRADGHVDPQKSDPRGGPGPLG